MAQRARFDVYGRFEVTAAKRPTGEWMFHLIGPEGKGTQLDDVVLPDEATLDDVARGLEATYHELATPDTDVRLIARE